MSMQVFETDKGLILKAENKKTPVLVHRRFTTVGDLVKVIKTTDPTLTGLSQTEVSTIIGGDEPTLTVTGTPIWASVGHHGKPATKMGERFMQAMRQHTEHHSFTRQEDQIIRDNEGKLVSDIHALLPEHPMQSVITHIYRLGYSIVQGRVRDASMLTKVKARKAWSDEDTRRLKDSLAKHDKAYTLSLFPDRSPSSVSTYTSVLGYTVGVKRFGYPKPTTGGHRYFTQQDRERLLTAAQRREDVTGLFPHVSERTVREKASMIGVVIRNGVAQLKAPDSYGRKTVTDVLDRYVAGEGRRAQVLIVFPDGSVYSHGRETEQ